MKHQIFFKVFWVFAFSFFIMPSLSLGQTSSNQKQIDEIVKNLGSNNKTLILKIAPSGKLTRKESHSNTIVAPGSVKPKIVCSSSKGVTFARCVGSWLDANKGKCLKVKESNGTYTADDNCN